MAAVVFAVFAVGASWVGGHAPAGQVRVLLGATGLFFFLMTLVPAVFFSRMAPHDLVVSLPVCVLMGLCSQLYFSLDSGWVGALFGMIGGAVLGLISYGGMRFRFWVIDKAMSRSKERWGAR
jgi:hypothetical protein